jgi:hypothetical protein
MKTSGEVGGPSLTRKREESSGSQVFTCVVVVT